MGSGNAEITQIVFDSIWRKKRKLCYYPIDISDGNLYHHVYSFI